MMTKKSLFTLLAVSALTLMTGKMAFADTTDSTATQTGVANTDQLIQKMTAQTNTLTSQIKLLKTQIQQLKLQQQALEAQQQKQTEAAPASGNNTQKVYTAQSNAAPQLPPVSYIDGSPIIVAPYVGNHTTFNASDLIINYSTYNEDLSLLELRQSIFDEYQQRNAPVPTNPTLMLSGEVAGQAIYQKPYTGEHNSQIALADAEVDIVPVINQWASGLLALKYDNSQIPDTPLTSNSRVFVDRGFLTLGNLNALPLYLTIGQMYVPFGAYSSNMITVPITEAVFQTRARALLLGYQAANGQGPYAQAYGFNGDATTTHTGNINDLGANLGWDAKQDNWNMDVGAGAIADVADSLGMQQTGATTGFAGFSTPLPNNPTPEVLQRQVPGVAAHANVGVGNFGLNSEYITATSAFAAQDMTYNDSAAKPQALNVETYYNFPVFDKPSAVTVGYGNSWQALALNVPERRYIAAFTTSIWKETIEELEFRHDINYDTSDNAAVDSVAIPASVKGGSSNTLTLQLGIYF